MQQKTIEQQQAFCRRLPKLVHQKITKELHAHLNGSLNHEIILELLELAGDEALKAEYQTYETTEAIKDISEYKQKLIQRFPVIWLRL